MVPADSRKIPRVPRYSGYHLVCNLYPYGTVTRYGQPFQTVPVRLQVHVVVLLPQSCLNSIGLGSSAFARHYLRNHCCFLLLEVMRCFSSLRLPPLYVGSAPSTHWVAPFGNPRIKGYLLLPEACRSLSRPSSPPIAKASTIRPSLLLLFL